MSLVFSPESSGNMPFDYDLYSRTEFVHPCEVDIQKGQTGLPRKSLKQIISEKYGYGEGSHITDNLTPDGIVFRSENDTIMIPYSLGSGDLHLPSEIEGYMRVADYLYPGAVKFLGEFYAPVLVFDQTKEVQEVLLFRYNPEKDSNCLRFSLPKLEEERAIIDLLYGYEADDRYMALVFKSQIGDEFEVFVDIDSVFK